MLSRLNAVAALVGVAVSCLGCRGGMTCGTSCSSSSPYAFMKYDCGCESCDGGCGAGGGQCGCGADVTCGEACTCGQGCTDGSCVGGSDGGGCGCGKCGDGCCACGKRSPCWVLNVFCRCTDCGEWYWNEWYNDPPRCAEPCDCYGNWISSGVAGNYRAPYRSHHGWLAGHDASQDSALASQDHNAPQEVDSQQVQDSSGAALHGDGQDNAGGGDEALEPAVYDDADLVPELQ